MNRHQNWVGELALSTTLVWVCVSCRTSVRALAAVQSLLRY